MPKAMCAASWAILSGDEFGVALSQNVPVASATRINTAEIQCSATNAG
jgi:hypothetical protein